MKNREIPSKINQMNINHLSVSRAQLFNDCQAKYKFRYHLNLKIEGPEPYYFEYGKIIHKISESYVENKTKKPIGEILNEINAGDIPLERDGGVKKNFLTNMPQEYKNKLPKHLRAIENLTSSLGTEGFLEWEFKYDLESPNSKNVVGFIDRLFQKGDLWYIIDYKTTKEGRYQKDANSILDDLQMRTYARIVQKTFNVPAENIRPALYYLENNNLVACKYNNTVLEDVEKELLDIYNQILETDPDHAWAKVGNQCERCDYKKVCPAYRSEKIYNNYLKGN